MAVNYRSNFSTTDSSFLPTFYSNNSSDSSYSTAHSLVNPQQPSTSSNNNNNNNNQTTLFLLSNNENCRNSNYYNSDDSNDEFYFTPRSTNSLDTNNNNLQIPNPISETSFNCLRNNISPAHSFYADFLPSVSTTTQNQLNPISKTSTTYPYSTRLINTQASKSSLRSCSSGSLSSLSSANRLQIMPQNRVYANKLFLQQQPLLSGAAERLAVPPPPAKRSFAGFASSYREGNNDAKSNGTRTLLVAPPPPAKRSFAGFASSYREGNNDAKSHHTIHSNDATFESNDATFEYLKNNSHVNPPSRLAINMINATSPSIALAMGMTSQVTAQSTNAQHLGTSSGNGDLPANNADSGSSDVNKTSRLKIRGGFEPHHLEPLNKHRGELSINEKYRYDLSRAQLKASSRTSALLAGFAMVALVELQYDQSTPRPLLIVLGVVTTLLVSVHLLALMMSTCLLPYIEANGCTQDSPHIKLKFYIELSWLFSTCIGLILFLVEIGVIFFVKFIAVGYNLAAYITTGMLVPVLIIFIVISYLIHRSRFTYSMDRVNDKVVDLQNFLNEAEVTPPSTSNSTHRNMVGVGLPSISMVKNHQEIV